MRIGTDNVCLPLLVSKEHDPLVCSAALFNLGCCAWFA
jgi:hypothetical protein